MGQNIIAVNGKIKLPKWGGGAVVNLGDNYFTPYSFTLSFDYKTDQIGGCTMLVSSSSRADNGTQTPGFHVRIYGTSLYFGVNKSAKFGDFYLMIPAFDVSEYNLTKYNRFVCKFTHSYNHTEGDKNNLSVYINGSLLVSKDVEDGALTQAERDVGILYTNPNKLYLNRYNNEFVNEDAYYDNVRYYPYGLTEEMIDAIFELPSAEFNFDNANLFDLTNTYEFQHHYMGSMATGIDGTVVLKQWGTSAVVDFGDDYFTPYSFTVSFDYKTDQSGGDRLLFSNASSVNEGTEVPGFHIRIYNSSLYFGVQNSVGIHDYYLMMDNADIVNVSGYDLGVMHRFVFKFTHSYNNTEGDKNNLSIYIDGALVGSKDVENGRLTQAQRNAGIVYTNPNRVYLNRWRNVWVGDTSVYDNVKIYREALSEEAITELFSTIPTNWEAYITNLTYDWSTTQTVGIMNSNSNVIDPTYLYSNFVNSATRITLGLTVEQFDVVMQDSTIDKYGNYCKLKTGLMNTHGVLSGALYDMTLNHCREEAIRLGWISG